MSLLCLICAFISIYLINEIKKRHIQTIDNIALELQLRSMDAYIKDVTEKNNEIRALKHDMKNKLLVYKSFIDSNNIESIQNDIIKTLALPALSEPVSYCAK